MKIKIKDSQRKNKYYSRKSKCGCSELREVRGREMSNKF